MYLASKGAESNWPLSAIIIAELLVHAFQTAASTCDSGTSSPWTAHFFPNYQSSSSAILWVLSCALADGVSMLSSLSSSASDSPVEFAGRLPPARSALGETFVSGMVSPICGLYKIATTAGWPREACLPLQAEPAGKRMSAVSKQYSISELKRYTVPHGYNLTDLLVAATCLAAQDYSQELFKLSVPRLKIGLRLPLHRSVCPDPTLESRCGFAALELSLPTQRDSDSMREFVHETSRRSREAKAGVKAMCSHALADVLGGVLPPGVAQLAAQMLEDSHELAIESIGGPTREMRVMGKRVTDYIYVPGNLCRNGISVGMCGYDDSLRVLVHSDLHQLSTPAKFLELMDNNLWAILSLL